MWPPSSPGPLLLPPALSLRPRQCWLQWPRGWLSGLGGCCPFSNPSHLCPPIPTLPILADPGCLLFGCHSILPSWSGDLQASAPSRGDNRASTLAFTSCSVDSRSQEGQHCHLRPSRGPLWPALLLDFTTTSASASELLGVGKVHSFPFSFRFPILFGGNKSFLHTKASFSYRGPTWSSHPKVSKLPASLL